MEFIDDLKVKTMDIAQAGVAKSKQLVDITKLNVVNVAEQENIKKYYMELGRLYYAERGMAPEAAYVALCGKITDAKAGVEKNKATIEKLKQQDAEKTADTSSVVAEVPYEEPVCDGDCGCCGAVVSEPVAEDVAEVEVAPVAEDPNAGDYEEL